MAFALLSEEARGGEDCPAPGAIWECSRGEAAPAEVRRVVIHTSSCSGCAELWRLAREMAGGPRAAPAAPRAPRARPRWIGLAAAAAVLLAAGAAIRLLTEPARTDLPVLREGEGEDAAIRSLVPESEPLPRAAVFLKWTDLGQGARYNVLVGTEDLTVLASPKGLASAEYAVPVETLEGLPPGAAILWRVEAVFPDGRRLASPTFRVRVR